jgi:hypothetical protein
MPHAIQIRQTGGPEVLNWTPIRRLARELNSTIRGLGQASRSTNAARAKQADWDGVLGHKMRVENG